MKLLSAIASALFFTSTLALQSKPFFLVLKSSNSSINGHTLDAGHEGAGIEGLLLSQKIAGAKKNSPAYHTFYFNYTKEQPNDGTLVWNLKGGNFFESQGMSFYNDPSTNVGLALFQPTDQWQEVSFDSNNDMYIKDYLNDQVSPPTDGKLRDLYRWELCEYNYSAYIYPVLCWTFGKYPPQNPSCQSVNVTRVYK